MTARTCLNCINWVVLNLHHIRHGEPVRSCSYGEACDRLCHFRPGKSPAEDENFIRTALRVRGREAGGG